MGTIDASAFPHIIDNILDDLVLDHPAALALQGTCREWQHKIRASVFAHIRSTAVESDDGNLRLFNTMTTVYQFSTLPSPGGRGLRWPAVTYMEAVYIEGFLIKDFQPPPLPPSLVSASPFIRALDLHGRLPRAVCRALESLPMEITLLRGEAYPRSRNTNSPPPLSDPIWYGSPIRHLKTKGGRALPSLTVHIDISDILLDLWDHPLFIRILSSPEPLLFYAVCFPADHYSDIIDTLYLINRMVYKNGSPTVTLVGLEALQMFENSEKSDPKSLFETVIQMARGEGSTLFVDSTPPRTPTFMTHDEYQSEFGHGTYRYEPEPLDVSAEATAPNTKPAKQTSSVHT